MREWITWESVVVALCMALFAGVLEYLMTGGTSGWIPLIAGLAGIPLGSLAAAPIIAIVHRVRLWDKSSLNRKQGRGLGDEQKKEILIRSLNVLRYTLRVMCVEKSKPMSFALCEDAADVKKHLLAMGIKSPDIVSIGKQCPLTWHMFLTQVIPALELGDLEHARSAIRRIDIPHQGWRPS